MKVMNKIFFAMLFAIVLISVAFGHKISSPYLSATFCGTIMAILFNNFLIGLRTK